MTTPLATQQAALAAAREAWNVFSALYNEAAQALVLIPELGDVLAMFRTVEAVTVAGRPVLKAAIEAVGGLTSPTPSPTEQARAKALAEAISALLQSYEASGDLDVIALDVEHTDTTVSVGQVSFI